MGDILRVCKRLASYVEEEATRIGIPMTFCALDAHGNLILKERMTGAKLVSIEMSERKAYTALALNIKTADITDLAVPGESLHTLTSVAGGRFVAFGGGVPLHVEGNLVAGIGVSGGTTQQDISVLEVAMGKFEREG